MVNQIIIKAHLVKKDGILRLVIPKDIRESLGVEAGDYLIVSKDKKNRIIYRKIRSL